MTVVYEPERIPADCPDVAAVVLIGRERQAKGRAESTAGYDITSHAGTAAEIGGLVRGHWGIENGRHWVLDVVFREDESRTRDTNAGANLSMLRKVAVSLLRNAKTTGRVETRRLRAAWDEEFLFAVVQGIAAS